MQNVGRNNFHHNGIPEFARGGDRSLGTVAHHLRCRRDACLSQQSFGLCFARRRCRQTESGNGWRRQVGGLGKGFAKTTHGLDRCNGTTRIFEHGETILLVFADLFTRRDQTQHKQTIRMLGADQFELFAQTRRNRGGAGCIGKKAKDRGVAAFGDQRVCKRIQ